MIAESRYNVGLVGLNGTCIYCPRFVSVEVRTNMKGAIENTCEVFSVV